MGLAVENQMVGGRVQRWTGRCLKGGIQEGCYVTGMRIGAGVCH